MKRINISPRPDYKAKLEKLAFRFHSLDNIYWDESAYYEFTMTEVNKIEEATSELNDLMLKAVQHVIDNKLYSKLFINENIIPLIERSWNYEEPSIYGRYDLGYDGTNIKMLEFNADTPTSLYEAGVIQWYWLQELFPDKDQFSSIHERLIAYWQSVREYFGDETLYFTCIQDSMEDYTTVEYLRDAANQAGLKTKFIFIGDIGWVETSKIFTDSQDLQIKNIFKLYPWEWLSNEEFGKNLTADINACKWIEPAWKSVLSNKAILPILYELNPNNALILPAYFDNPNNMDCYVKKPIYSREGANVEITEHGKVTASTEGEYGEEGFIYQELFQIPMFTNEKSTTNRPVIGSWVIDQKAAGMGIRESDNEITDNFSRFIPHLIN